MQHALSTHLFVNHRLTVALLNRIMQAGIPRVEIFCARQHLDYYNKAQIMELAHWFRDADLKLHALHAPMYTDEIWGRSGPQTHISLTELTKGRRLEMVDEIKRVLEIAEHIPFTYLIQHLGVAEEEFSEFKIDAAFSALEQLVLFGHQRGVEILLENIPNRLSTPERLESFNEITHLHLNYVFDVGHAHMAEGGVEAAFEIMKPRIRSTHVHDNNGAEDKHLFPFYSEAGTVDWKKVMNLLRGCPAGCPLLLELREVPDLASPLERVNEVFDRLENLA